MDKNIHLSKSDIRKICTEELQELQLQKKKFC